MVSCFCSHFNDHWILLAMDCDRRSILKKQILILTLSFKKLKENKLRTRVSFFRLLPFHSPDFGPSRYPALQYKALPKLN